MQKIDLKISLYFSGTVLFFGVVLSLAGLVIVDKYILMGLILMTAAVLIFTTHYRLSIDLRNKTYYDYVWILGLKNGDRGKFERIEYLFIKKSKVNQTMNSLINSTTIHKDVYDAYLKFSDTHKIHLLTKDSKEKLVDRSKVIASALKVRIVDYSENEPKEIANS